MLEDIIGIFSAHFQTAEFVKVEREWRFDETWMDQKTHVAPDLARHEFKGHDAIERHKAAMRPHDHGPPLARDVLAPFDLNAPVVIVEEFEDSAPLCLDIAEVHSEVVEVRMLREVAPTPASLAIQHGQQGFGARALGYKAQFPLDFCVGHRP